MTEAEEEQRSGGRPAAVVVMGVSGCGKTLIGSALAEALRCRFVEGDTKHPPENVAKMASGIPLDDADRAGWLDAIGADMAATLAGGEGAIAACSALKRIYRDRLRRFVPNAAFVHLAIDRETARKRVAGRKGHFMPASLVKSQFAALESPGADENALTLDGTRPPAELVAAAMAFVRGD